MAHPVDPSALVLRIKNSPIELALTVFLHGLAGLAPWLSVLPLAWKQVLSALVLLALIRQLIGLSQTPAVLHLKRSGTCWFGDDKVSLYQVLPGTLVLPRLVVLQLKRAQSSRISKVIFRDALSADSHRRLRVWLKTKA